MEDHYKTSIMVSSIIIASDGIHMYVHVSVYGVHRSLLYLSLSLSLSLVTGTGLNELQIAFVCREILKVSISSMLRAYT